MKHRRKILSAGIVMIGLVIALALVLGAAGVAAPTLSTVTLSALAAPTKSPTPPSDAIPLKPISDLKSLNATVELNVNGLIDGERAQGDLTGLLTANDQKKSKITISGSLLGDIAAQVGGSLVGLFTPSKVDLYKVPDGAFVVLGGLLPVCIKPDVPKATETLDEMSPASLLSMLTNSDVARGEFVGNETLNGRPGQALCSGWRGLSWPRPRRATMSNSSPLPTRCGRRKTPIFRGREGGLPVAFRGSFSGEYEPLGFEGDFDVNIELTDINTNSPVSLPKACNKPISQ